MKSLKKGGGGEKKSKKCKKKKKRERFLFYFKYYYLFSTIDIAKLIFSTIDIAKQKKNPKNLYTIIWREKEIYLILIWSKL